MYTVVAGVSDEQIHSGLILGEKINEQEISDKFIETSVSEDGDTFYYESNDINMYVKTSKDGEVNNVKLQKNIQYDELLNVGDVEEFAENNKTDEDMADVNWQSGKIKINNNYITLPCKVNDIIEASNNTVKIDDGTLKYRQTVESNNAMYIGLVESANSNTTICKLRLENRSEQSISVQDADVYGISVDTRLKDYKDDSTKFDIVYPESLRLDQAYKIEHLEELLGDNWVEAFGHDGIAWIEEGADGTYSQISINTDKDKIISINLEIGCKDLWVQP